jgi:Metal-dependent hydrolase
MNPTFRRFRVSLVVLSLLSIVIGKKVSAATNDSVQLRVVTYNLRYASSSGPNSWPQRRPLVREVVESLSPDIMGTQEGVLDQLKDIAADLPDYAWIGTGRDGGNKGEFMAVFYRTNRFEPLATNHFWLSDTPEVEASTTWGNSIRRMVTWIRFRERASGIEFAFFNTHFDHAVELARQKSATLLRWRIQQLPAELPVIVTGDFNSSPNSAAYRTLTDEGFLTDAWKSSPIRKNESIGTFNSFQGIRTNGPRIDWILTRGNVKTLESAIDITKPNGQWASDHFPVLSVLEVSSTQSAKASGN